VVIVISFLCLHASLYLQTFISSSSSQAASSSLRIGGDSGGLTPDSMRPEDFAALKKFKKSKSKVNDCCLRSLQCISWY
jgi:hypothetical protein